MSKARRPFHRKQRGMMVTRMLARDGEHCGICGDPLDRSIRDFWHPRYITFDHIRPISRGGITHHSNLRLTHLQCNQQRADAWPETDDS